jgi:hypothetical protein
MAAKKKAKKQAAKDTGMRELLDLLKDRPHLVRALIFDRAKVGRLLRTKAGRALLAAADPDDPQVVGVVKDGSYYLSFRCLKRSN